MSPTWNVEFELTDCFYSMSDTQYYIENIVKNMKHYPLILLFINGINNRLVFKTKDGCKLELQTPETMKLFDSTKQ